VNGSRGFKAGSLSLFLIFDQQTAFLGKEFYTSNNVCFLFTATAFFNWYRKKQLQGNAELYAKLTPKYPLGCNVLTTSSLYYPTFLNPKVKLVNSPITEIMDGKTICTEDGREHSPDVSILNSFWTE
jgi:hypothetical protein